MDEKTRKLRELRLAREAAVKNANRVRQAARQAAAERVIVDMAERAREALRTNGHDYVLDRFFGIKK